MTEAPGSPLTKTAQQMAGSTDEDQFVFPEDELNQARKDHKGPKKICVIGGGIAGLTSAYELLLDPANNHQVVLVEASKHLGGRIRTWHPHKDTNPDLHGEMAPMRIPPNHNGTIHYVDRFDLRTGLFVQSNLNGWCQVGDHKYRRSEFGKLIADYEKSSGTKFLNLRWAGPSDDPQTLMVRALSENLSHKLGKRRVLSDLLDPVTQAFDRVSLWQFMRDMDIQPKAPLIPGGLPSVDHKPRRPGGLGAELFTYEEWELLSRASGQYWRESVSALEAHFEHYTILGGDNRFRLLDGMEALPKALEGKIQDWTAGKGKTERARIDCKLRVTKISMDPHAADHPMRVFAVDGGNNERPIEAIGGGGFDYVICAAPAPAVARIRFTPPLPQKQAEAFSGLPYMNAAKYLLHMKERRWEDPARTHGLPIFGGASYTDQLIQQCWYPSDHAKVMFDHGANQVELVYTPRVVLAGGGKFSTLEVKGDPNNPEGWKEPAVLTGAYMTGVNADRFISLTDDEKLTAVLACLEQFHKGISDDLHYVDGVPCVVSCAWMEQQIPGGGAWTLFEPGGHERFQGHLGESHPQPPSHSRVFFAGEHIRAPHGWMQSAISSSMQATLAVLNAR